MLYDIYVQEFVQDWNNEKHAQIKTLKTIKEDYKINFKEVK